MLLKPECISSNSNIGPIEPDLVWKVNNKKPMLCHIGSSKTFQKAQATTQQRKKTQVIENPLLVKTVFKQKEYLFWEDSIIHRGENK